MCLQALCCSKHIHVYELKVHLCLDLVHTYIVKKVTMITYTALQLLDVGLLMLTCANNFGLRQHIVQLTHVPDITDPLGWVSCAI